MATTKITFDLVLAPEYWRILKIHLKGQVRIYNGPGMPGPVTLTPVKEDVGMLICTATLPEELTPDVVSRELTISVPGQEDVVKTVDVSVTEIPDLRFPQDEEFTTSLVDIDDAGNRSEPRVQKVTLTDTIPPAQPGEIGFTVTGEE